MQERLMVEAIFLLWDGLFAPKMIYSWQLVAISRNAMYLSCNECIKSRTVLHRNTIIASLTAKLKKSARACTCIFTNSWQAGKLAIKYSANAPRTGQTLEKGLLLDQRADDEAAESGIRIRVGVGVAVGFLAIVGKFYFPLGTECWVF